MSERPEDCPICSGMCADGHPDSTERAAPSEPRRHRSTDAGHDGSKSYGVCRVCRAEALDGVRRAVEGMDDIYETDTADEISRYAVLAAIEEASRD